MIAPHPPENAVILGNGGTFKVPEGGFSGWATSPSTGWRKFTFLLGDSPRRTYAAPNGSPVALLNGHGKPAASEATDPDIGPISEGHVCKHGVRWPHECQPCADVAWKASDATRESTAGEDERFQERAMQAFPVRATKPAGAGSETATALRPEFAAEVAKMPIEELRRRVLIQADWHQRFAACLDGLGAHQGTDHYRGPREIRGAFEKLKAELAEVRRRLDPNEMKGEYIGEFSFDIEDCDEAGEPCSRSVTVPWTTIKEIMAMIGKVEKLQPGEGR